MNNKLQVKETLVLDSREVAEMMEVKHWEILRKIEGSKDRKGYIEILNDNQMVVADYFVESSYLDKKGERRTCYLLTRMGCEFLANKFTGEKGVIFTARYVKRFNEMEKALVENENKRVIPDAKEKEIEAKLKNARVREANIYLKIADRIEVPEYQQVMYSKATEALSGEQLLPLPEVKERTYTATEIAKEIGSTPQMVGRLANKHGLKESEYGIEVWDKSPYSAKQVSAWRYNERGRQRLISIFNSRKESYIE